LILLFNKVFFDVMIWTKNGVGYILGDFFTNSSGHPGPILLRRDVLPGCQILLGKTYQNGR
jgi:hypothetical protein